MLFVCSREPVRPQLRLCQQVRLDVFYTRKEKNVLNRLLRSQEDTVFCVIRVFGRNQMRLVLSMAALSCMSFSYRGVQAFQTVARTSSRADSIHAFGLPSARMGNLAKKSDYLTKVFSSVENEVDPGEVEGTDLRVLKYPHPSLRAENAEITEEELADGSIAKIAKEMFLVMYAAEGVGLAAPQVGINKKLMVYNETGDKKKWLQEIVMVNPKIVEFSEAIDDATEGCLSFPDMGGDVTRSKWIKVEAMSLKGKKIKKRFKGWEARIFQHEYDHLDGVVYIDRLSKEGKKEVQPQLDVLVEDFGEDGAL